MTDWYVLLAHLDIFGYIPSFHAVSAVTMLYVYYSSVVKTEVIVHIVIHKPFQCNSKMSNAT